MRVKITPKTRKAWDIFFRHMKKDPYMYCDERLDKWHLVNFTKGISFWVDPRNDPDWEIKH